VDERSATITLSGTNVTSQTITIIQEGATPILSVDPTSADVTAESGTSTHTVTSNIDWAISESSDWLTATKTNATTLTISYDENLSVDERSATITLSGTGVTSQTVTINQEGATPVLTVDPTSADVTAESGTSTYTVTSNIDWTVSETTDWLTATKTNATTLTISYDENLSVDERSETITLSGTGVASQTVTITQDGATPVLSVDPTAASVTAESGTSTHTVTSNIDWAISETADWLTATETNATTLTISYDENLSVDERSATITLSGTGVTSQTVTITQDGATPVLSVDPISADVTAESGTSTHTVTSNIDWAVSESSDWLVATKTNATTLTITYDENTSVDERSATITLSGTDVTSQTVTINQQGASTTSNLSLSVSSLSIGQPSGSEGSFSITSNVVWEVSSDVSWLSISPISGSDDGNIIVTSTEANIDPNSRTATITVSSTDVSSQYITITQLGTNPEITINPTNLTLDQPSGSFEMFSIVSNISWEVSTDASWITLSTSNGTDNGSVTVTANSANNNSESRTGTVNVTGNEIDPQYITVTQSGNNPELTVTPTSLTLDQTSGSSETFSITSNISWEINIDANWLDVSPISGSENGIVTVTTNSANTETNHRTATVIVSGTDVSPQNVTVIQEGESSSEINITSPQYSTNWQIGTNNEISWIDNVSENVKIDLYVGDVFEDIIELSASNNGSYDWQISSELEVRNDYQIKISSLDVNDLYGFSGYFSLYEVECNDPFEPNNDYSRAINITSYNPFINELLCLTSVDEDWFKLYINSDAYYFKIYGSGLGGYGINAAYSDDNISITTYETNGPTDTKISLYGSDHITELAFDDNSGDGPFAILNYDIDVVHVMENQRNDIRVFPNPSYDKTIIEFDNPNRDKYDLRIYSLTGELVYSLKDIYNNRIVIDAEILETGCYFVEISGVKIYRTKLLKE